MKRECWLAKFDPLESPCRNRPDGQLDPCHLISQQRLKRAGVEDVWDQRLWVWACRGHHGRFDVAGINPIRLEPSDYPPELLAWVQQNHWHWDARKGWIPSAVAVA